MIDFSYIIVNFRTPELTAEAVKSIIAHEKKSSYEIIVVENGSGDHSFSYLSKNLPKNIKIIKSEENLGFGQGNNLGSLKAKGRFFVIFNSDAYEVEAILPKIRKTFEQNSKISILGTKILFPNYQLQPSHGSRPGLLSVFFWMFFFDDIPLLRLCLPSLHKNHKYFYRRTIKTGWVTGAMMVFKRGVYRQLNGFNRDIFMYAEDIDICLRAKKKGLLTFFTPEIHIIHLGQQSSKGLPDTALVNEFKGLLFVVKSNFNPFKYLGIKVIMTLGALLRLIIFGIILRSSEKKRIYSQTLKIIW